MKKGIIFDVDGTIWDSVENVTRAWNQVIIASGHEDLCVEAEAMRGYFGKTLPVFADRFFPQLDPEARMELANRCYDTQVAYLNEHGGQLYEGIEETLLKLKERGYHLYIVSNCPVGYIESMLNFAKLWDYFEDTECAGKTGLSKGENIRLITARNQLDAAVYVGDIQSDYEASQQAGVKFIHAAYGFGTVDAKVPRILSFTDLQTMDFDGIME